MLPAALAAFVAGVFLLQQQAALPAPATLAALALVALVLGALALRGRRQQDADEKWFAAAIVVTCACAAGFAYAGLRAQQRLEVALPYADEGRDVEIVGVVAGLPTAIERGQRFEFEVEQVVTAGVSVPPRLSLAWYAADAAVVPGERWAFTARLRRPHGSFNPGGFDLEGWLFERNLRASGYVREKPAPRRLSPMVWTARSAIDRARAELRSRLQARVSGLPLGGVLTALVLGDQRAIAEADWLLFNRTGISHLVSISGLHITMISGLLALLVGGLWRRSARTLALAPAQRDVQATQVVRLPAGLPWWACPVLYLPTLQLLAYHRAASKGLDPDNPRHLDAVVTLDVAALTSTH
jgi:competence protein ComEC